jgi:hypothetical protein
MCLTNPIHNRISNDLKSHAYLYLLCNKQFSPCVENIITLSTMTTLKQTSIPCLPQVFSIVSFHNNVLIIIIRTINSISVYLLRPRYITYYLIAAASLLKVLERQKVNDLPAKFILHYYLLYRFISISVINHLLLYFHYCLFSAG